MATIHILPPGHKPVKAPVPAKRVAEARPALVRSPVQDRPTTAPLFRLNLRFILVVLSLMPEPKRPW